MKIIDGAVEHDRVFDIDEMPALGKHQQPGVGHGSLEEHIGVDDEFVLVPDHQQRRHLERGEFGLEVIQRGALALHLAQCVARALGEKPAK